MGEHHYGIGGEITRSRAKMINSVCVRERERVLPVDLSVTIIIVICCFFGLDDNWGLFWSCGIAVSTALWHFVKSLNYWLE
jgi:hypothetical protein